MTRVYRIVRKLYSKKAFDGEGAHQFGGRWSSPGTRLAYTSGHLSLAMIEYYVHVDPGDLPSDLVVVAADIPDSVSHTRISISRLPASWRATPAPAALAAIGDAFARTRRAAILIVPSALVPSESNWLINPLHPEFAKIRVPSPEPFRYDARFLK